MVTTLGLDTHTYKTLSEALSAAHEDAEIYEVKFFHSLANRPDEHVTLTRDGSNTWSISIYHKGKTRKF